MADLQATDVRVSPAASPHDRPGLGSQLWSVPSALLARGLALATILVFLAYGRSLSVGFLSDDFNILEDLRSLGPMSRWASEGQPFFRPLVAWSYFLELKIWGLNAWPFHLANLLMHLAAGVGVSVLAAQLTERFTHWNRREQWQVGAAAGLLFLCHPSHVEPVAWVSCRGDLQAAAFAVACLVFHSRWIALGRLFRSTATATQGSSLATQSRWKWRLAAVLALVGALGSKEAAVTLPLAILALEWLGGRGPWNQRLVGSFRAALPFLALLPVYLVVRTWVLGTFIGGYGTSIHLNLPPVRVLDRLFTSFSRSVIPLISGQQLPEGAAAVVLGALMMGTLWKMTRGKFADSTGRPGVVLPVLCLVLFAISAVPALGMRVADNSTSAERLLYLPSVFAMILLALLLQVAIRGTRRRWWSLAILCAVFTAQTAWSMEPWRHAGKATETVLETLLELDAERRTYLLGVPDSIGGAYVFRNGLGSALRLRGKNGSNAILVHRVMMPEADCEFEIRWRGHTAFLSFKERRCRGRFRYLRWPRSLVEEVRSGFYKSRFRLPQLTQADRILLYSGGRFRLIQSGSSGPSASDSSPNQ